MEFWTINLTALSPLLTKLPPPSPGSPTKKLSPPTAVPNRQPHPQTIETNTFAPRSPESVSDQDITACEEGSPVLFPAHVPTYVFIFSAVTFSQFPIETL